MRNRRLDLGRYFRVDEKAALLRFEESWCATERSLEEFEERSREATFAPGVGLLGPRMGVKQAFMVHRHRCTSHRAARTLAQFEMRGACMFPVVSQGKPIGVMALLAPGPASRTSGCSGAARDRKPDRAVSRAPGAAKAHRPPQPDLRGLSGINATIVRVRERGSCFAKPAGSW